MDEDLTRREMLQVTGGSFAAFGLGGAGDDERLISGGLGDRTAADVTAYDDLDVTRLGADHLFTPSRNADVVVWRTENRFYADGPDGVVGSGADFSNVLQAAIAEDPTKIVIAPGTYEMNETVSVPSDTVVQGMGPGTKLIVNDSRGFEVCGRELGTTRLSRDADVSDERLAVRNASGFEAGQYVLVFSDRATDYRNHTYGELQKVREVDGNELVIEHGGLFDYYDTADDARVTALDVATNVAIRDFQIVGADREVYRSGVVAEYADNVSVDGCEIHDLSSAAVRFVSTLNGSVSNSELYDVGYPHAGMGYGVVVADASRNITVRDNVMYEFKNHCTAVGGGGDGFPRFISFVDNEYYADDADIHFGDQVLFRGNRFVNCKNGVLTGADSTWIDGCTFENISGHGVRHRGNPKQLSVTNSSFVNIGKRALNLYNSPSTFRRVTVRANVFENVGSNVVRFRVADGYDADLFEFSNNYVSGCDTTVAYAELAGAGSIRTAVFDGNVIQDIEGLGIGTGPLSDATVQITNNVLRGVDNQYAVIARGRHNQVSNNAVTDYSGRGLLVKSPSQVVGNAFADGDRDAILVHDAENVLAAFNTFENTAGADIRAKDSTDCEFVFNHYATVLATGDNEAQFNTQI